MANPIVCFAHHFPLGCDHHGHEAVGLDQILQQVERGNATCLACGHKADLRQQVKDFNTLGSPEMLFGQSVMVFSKDIPASSDHHVAIFDPPDLLGPKNTRIAYANITPGGTMSFDEIPWLLAPQSLHQEWHLPMRFYVPPGPKRVLCIMLALRAADPLDQPVDLALQAVDSFHRGHFSIAGVLLAASIESSLRRRVEQCYATRGVKAPGDLGFMSLLERARLLLDPQPGPKLIENLKKLSKECRNPVAHGGVATASSRTDMAGWMVDTAVVYEWTKAARSKV